MPAVAIPSKPALHSSFTSAITSLGPKSTILDLGCGNGTIAHHISSSFGLHVIAVDVNPEAISKARQLYSRPQQTSQRSKCCPQKAAPAQCSTHRHPHPPTDASSPTPQLSFHVGDATSVCLLPRLFDVVLLQLVISIVGDLAQRHKLLHNAYRHCRPGGLLLLSGMATADGEYASF